MLQDYIEDIKPVACLFGISGSLMVCLLFAYKQTIPPEGDRCEQLKSEIEAVEKRCYYALVAHNLIESAVVSGNAAKASEAVALHREANEKWQSIPPGTVIARGFGPHPPPVGAAKEVQSLSSRASSLEFAVKGSQLELARDRGALLESTSAAHLWADRLSKLSELDGIHQAHSTYYTGVSGFLLRATRALSKPIALLLIFPVGISAIALILSIPRLFIELLNWPDEPTNPRSRQRT